MRRLFVSDVHLDSRYPQTAAAFTALLSGPARDVDEIYILGDLFEYWLGDDDDDAFKIHYAEELGQLTSTGVRGFFMCGNRDFMIGNDFLERTGLTGLDDPTVISIQDRRLLLSHGDEWCTDDIEYQAFRQQVRNPVWQEKMRALPLAERKKLAEQMKTASNDATAGKDAAIMDVNKSAIGDLMRKHEVRQMLHGHTHRPAIHRFDLDGSMASRIVLGDWYSRSSYALWDDSGLHLLHNDFA